MADNKNIIDEKEFAAAEEEAKHAEAAYTHKFAKPFSWMGKTYEKLIFNFDTLTGNDFLAVEAVMNSRGKVLVTPAFSGDFLCLIAAKACGLGDDALCALPIADFSKIRSMARSFLLKTELT